MSSAVCPQRQSKPRNIPVISVCHLRYLSSGPFTLVQLLFLPPTSSHSSNYSVCTFINIPHSLRVCGNARKISKNISHACLRWNSLDVNKITMERNSVNWFSSTIWTQPEVLLQTLRGKQHVKYSLVTFWSVQFTYTSDKSFLHPYIQSFLYIDSSLYNLVL